MPGGQGQQEFPELLLVLQAGAGVSFPESAQPWQGLIGVTEFRSLCQ